MARSGGWDPFRELESVQQRMNKLFEAALSRTDYETDAGLGGWTPVADVYETDDRYDVCLELPGLSQDSIAVRIEEDELIVSGDRPIDRDQPGEHFHRVERSHGAFARKFRLPSTVDRTKVRATYRDGVLQVTLEKRAAREPESFRVSVD